MTLFTLNGQVLKLNTAEDIAPHLVELEKIKDLTEINLQGNTYGIEASKALAKALEHQKSLRVANLSDIFTGRLREEIPESLDAILTALLTCENLHTIDLSDNAFGIATIEPLEKFLSKHAPLQHLILANNGFGPAAGSRIGQALEKLVEVKTQKKVAAKLETVVCGRNRLENGSMEAWSKFLAAHGTIKELRLYSNGIRQEGIEHLLLNGLSKSPQLQNLDLQDNTFTLKGAQALSKVISKWEYLQELGIGDCLLTARGGQVFAQTLLDGKPIASLEKLKLQYNEIEVKGLEVLIKAIEKNIPNLKLLELNGNRFADDDELVDKITRLFEHRGLGELDELDDMEEESEEEEEEEEEIVEAIKDAEEEENQNVAPEKSVSVDALAEKIAKTEIE